MWNEEEYIHRAVGAAAEACEQLIDDGEIGDYELIIIDDASTDLTGRHADELVAPTPTSASSTTRNRKLGGCSRPGFAAATRRPRALHRRRPALRHGRAEAGVPPAAHLRGRHRQRLPLRPHRRGPAAPSTPRSTTCSSAAVRRPGSATSTSPSSCAAAACWTGSTLTSEGSFIDAELVIRAQKAGSRSCSSASTTSRGPAGSPRCPRRR